MLLTSVTYENSETRERWTKAWAEAAETGDLDKGFECEEFHACSLATRLLAVELWRSWQEHYGRDSAGEFMIGPDSLTVEGETLAYALTGHVCHRGPTNEDVASLCRAADELSTAGLVLQLHPGRWLIQFGRAYTPEEIARHEARRAATRAEYSSPPRARVLRLHGVRTDEKVEPVEPT